MSYKAEKLPFWKLVMFAMGQFGWSLAAFAPSNLLTFFYLSPETAEGAMFPTYIFTGSVVFGLTVIGLINFGGRFFDAITDPIIANMSDTNKSKFGKRRIFLAISCFPVALFAFLMFFPLIKSESGLNVLWLIMGILVYYLAITMYCTPYNALISELGHTPNERLNISTAISITWALGFIVGNMVYALIPAFRGAFGVDSTTALQLTVGLFGIISFVAMTLPVVFINESKYAENHVSDENVIQALKSAFSNKNFIRFAVSDLTYWLSLTFIQMGISYFIITLLGLSESMPTTLMTVLFLLSFLFYVPINFIAKKFGKKRILMLAFVVLGSVFVVTTFLGLLPIPKIAQGYLIVVLAALPLAIFGILPNAIVADIADADGIENGTYKAGIFFAARTFMMKLGISLANLIFPSFLLLGKTVDNPFGIRAAAFAAVIFCTV